MRDKAAFKRGIARLKAQGQQVTGGELIADLSVGFAPLHAGPGKGPTGGGGIGEGPGWAVAAPPGPAARRPPPRTRPASGAV